MSFLPLICPTRHVFFDQVRSISVRASTSKRSHWTPVKIRRPPERKEAMMFFVATVLAILSGLFYAASHHEIGSLGVTMCQYGSPFCDNPLLVLTGAGLAACWGAFVSVR
jgi:hypothetical protein